MQTELEAGFFKRFSEGNFKGPKDVTMLIQDAANRTYYVKDIRDELRLLRQVFEMQSNVVTDFAEIFWPKSTVTGGQKQDRVAANDLRDSFVRDCGLQSLIQRVKRMESDASTTLEGVGIWA